MRTLEEEIAKLILTVAVEKPKPNYTEVYTGLYVFPAMTEAFIRTRLVADIVGVARQYLARETNRSAKHKVAIGAAPAVAGYLPAGGASGGT